MEKNYALLISSCDKYSDLWPWHIRLLERHWKGDWPTVYLITDKQTTFSRDNVRVLCFDGDMPTRLKKALSVIDRQCVLITLDDYFLIDDVDENKITNLTNYSIQKNIDYLCLYDRRNAKGYGYRGKDIIKPIDLSEEYAVNLYPSIWNKDFFLSCVCEDESPWSFESKLTNKAKQFSANCEIDLSGVFVILDVVRKGHVLHKANRYFKKNHITIGNRPLLPKRTETKLFIMDFIKFHTPKWFSRNMKKAAKKMGMKFYSD